MSLHYCVIEDETYASSQFSLSTAEEAENYFSSSVKVEQPESTVPLMEPGTYRMIDGVLYRLLSGRPRDSAEVRS